MYYFLYNALCFWYIGTFFNFHYEFLLCVCVLVVGAA